MKYIIKHFIICVWVATFALALPTRGEESITMPMEGASLAEFQYYVGRIDGKNGIIQNDLVKLYSVNGSGTLVGSKLTTVLTAAHVVIDKNSSIIFGAKFSTRDAVRNITSIQILSGYQPNYIRIPKIGDVGDRDFEDDAAVLTISKVPKVVFSGKPTPPSYGMVGLVRPKINAADDLSKSVYKGPAWKGFFGYYNAPGETYNPKASVQPPKLESRSSRNSFDRDLRYWFGPIYTLYTDEYVEEGMSGGPAVIHLPEPEGPSFLRSFNQVGVIVGSYGSVDPYVVVRTLDKPILKILNAADNSISK